MVSVLKLTRHDMLFGDDIGILELLVEALGILELLVEALSHRLKRSGPHGQTTKNTMLCPLSPTLFKRPNNPSMGGALPSERTHRRSGGMERWCGSLLCS